jgi:hypothetical protein
VAQVIVDTSTLIALALATKERDIPAGDTRELWEYHGGIDGGIEALILNETVLIDRPSVDRNASNLPELMQFASIGQSATTETESDIYSAVTMAYVPHLKGGSSSTDLFRMHTEEWIAAEVGAASYYPSSDWRDIETELTNPEARELASRLRDKFAKHTPYSGAACALLLRTLYYDYLQRRCEADLVLHPLKAIYREAPKSSAGSSVLQLFDSKVRAAFYDRKKRWLGRDDLTISVPMLTNFILASCKSWEDLARVVFEVRVSPAAAKFREGMSELGAALRAKENAKVDEVLGELSAREVEWSRQLGSGGASKRISLSVPFIGVGTEITIPDKKLKVSTGDKILGFVHMLLAVA